MNQVNSPGYYQANPGSAQGGGTPAAPAVQTQPMMQQNQANAAAARASIESEIINDGLVDPVLKCQELYKHHLLTSLPVNSPNRSFKSILIRFKPILRVYLTN